jgi:hypothetical protein
VDPEADAKWYFGNRKVNMDLLSRIQSDFDLTGVPKCGLLGRFGQGKTHTLYHIKYLFDTEPETYPGICFQLGLGPYDEKVPYLNGWQYIHGKMLDAMGEVFLKQTVQAFDRRPGDRTRDLSEEMRKVFKSGDENLRRSLANVLSGYFLRETRSTLSAWQWLKGEKLDRGSAVLDMAVTKSLETAEDMVNVIINLGNLVRTTSGKGVVFLMDEGQDLSNVEKRSIEIHHAFLQLASDHNEDVGFVIASFGPGGESMIPEVLREPDDILSRLRVTSQNVGHAFINLGEIIDAEGTIRSFTDNLLEGIKDMVKAKKLVSELGLADKVTPSSLPFTEDGIARVVHILWENELTRNARMIINELARFAAFAYHQGKKKNQYVVVDEELVNAQIAHE